MKLSNKNFENPQWFNVISMFSLDCLVDLWDDIDVLVPDELRPQVINLCRKKTFEIIDGALDGELINLSTVRVAAVTESLCEELSLVASCDLANNFIDHCHKAFIVLWECHQLLFVWEAVILDIVYCEDANLQVLALKKSLARSEFQKLHECLKEYATWNFETVAIANQTYSSDDIELLDIVAPAFASEPRNYSLGLYKRMITNYRFASWWNTTLGPNFSSPDVIKIVEWLEIPRPPLPQALLSDYQCARKILGLEDFVA